MVTDSGRSQSTAKSAANALPIDRAWLVLLGASLCMFCGQSAVAYYTFGVFLPEIMSDTHWSAAAIAGSIGPGALIAAAVSPFVGRICDRFGVRAVALVGGPAYALGLAGLGLAPTGAKSFTGAMMLMWFLASAASPVPYAQMVTGWFDKRRGLALGVIFCCGALGIAVWPPFAASLIAQWGWRDAYAAIGVSAGAVVFLCALLLLKNAPISSMSAQGSALAPGMRVSEALRTLRFWKIAAIFMLLSAVLGGTAVDFPVILREHGADAHTAAAIMSVIGLAMFVGRLSLGLVLDRWFSPYITMAITAVSMLAYGLLFVGSTKIMLLAAAALVGYGLGSEYAVVAYMASRAFGVSAFGAIYGLLMLATSVGAALGPAIIGASLVSGVDNRLIFACAAGLLALAILILATLKKADLPFGSLRT